MPEDPRAKGAPTEEAALATSAEPRRAPDPTAQPERAQGAVALLRVAWPFALIAVLTVILGRAVGPSIAGTGVGMDRLVFVVEIAGKILSQLFAVGAIVLAMASIIAVSRGRLPSAVRFGSIGLGGAVILVNFLASPRRESLPVMMVILMGLAAAAFALLAAQSALRVTFARAAALIIGLIAVAALVRLGAIGLAVQAQAQGWAKLAGPARGVATAGFVIELIAVLLATAWVSTRSSRGLASPATLIVFGLALLLTRQAFRADLEDAGALNLLIRRAAEHLVTRPEPQLPHALSIFLAMLAPLLAIAALVVPQASSPAGEGEGSQQGSPPRQAQQPLRAPPMPPAIRASIALALLVRGAPEAPLGGLLLLLAALTLALGARDDRGVWDAIRREG